MTFGLTYWAVWEIKGCRNRNSPQKKDQSTMMNPSCHIKNSTESLLCSQKSFFQTPFIRNIYFKDQNMAIENLPPPPTAPTPPPRKWTQCTSKHLQKILVQGGSRDEDQFWMEWPPRNGSFAQHKIASDIWKVEAECFNYNLSCFVKIAHHTSSIKDSYSLFHSSVSVQLNFINVLECMKRWLQVD